MNERWREAAVLVAVSVAIPAACLPATSGEGEGESEPPDPAEAARLYGEASAAYYERCLRSGDSPYGFVGELDPQLYGLPGSASEYAERTEDIYGVLFAAYEENPLVEVGYDRVEPCAALLRDAPCDEATGGACDEIFVGVGEEGAPCAQRLECAQGICAEVGEDNCGRCVGPLERGDLCSTEPGAQPCPADTFCDVGGSNACTPHREISEVCTDDAQCGADLYCPEVAGRCTRYSAEGESCADGRECAEGLRCGLDAASGFVCEVDLIVPYLGAPCTGGFNQYCGNPLVTGLVCDAEPDALGSCRAIEVVEEDATCDIGTLGQLAGLLPSSRWCEYMLTSHYCDVAPGEDAGTCRRRPGPSEDCLDLELNAFGYCDRTRSFCVDGTCSSAVAGDACLDPGGSGEPSECAYGYACTEDDSGGATCVDLVDYFGEPPVCAG